MKVKELNQSENKHWSLSWMVIAACLILTSCARFGPMSLNNAVNNYDDKVLQVEQQILLRNIVRMHFDQPLHLTSVGGISATFTLAGNATLGPLSIGSNTGTITSHSSAGALSLGSAISESPTITITPMQGKDFAGRLLNPIDSKFVNTLFMQRSAPRLDKMLRLMGKNFYMMRPEKAKKIFECQKNPKENPIQGSLGCYLDNLENNEYKYSFPDFKELKKSKKFKDWGDVDFKAWGEKRGFNVEEAKCLLTTKDDDCYMENSPGKFGPEKDIRKYQLFRKVVLHIQAMALKCNDLSFSILDFDESDGGIKGAKVSDNLKDNIDAFEKQYRWEDAPPESNEQDSDKENVNGLILKEIEIPNSQNEKGFVLKEIKLPKSQEKSLILTKRYPIIAITDFDFDDYIENNKKTKIDTDENTKDYPKTISNKYILEEIRKDFELNAEIKLGEVMILVLLRGIKENHWPIYGYFTLRNFKQVLQFLAESINVQHDEYTNVKYAKEYGVEPSKFTIDYLKQDNHKQDNHNILLDNLDNPDLTLTINSGTAPHGDLLVETNYNGESFWISPFHKQKEAPTGYGNLFPPRWNGEVFSMLYDIFQFNGMEPAVATTPSISIAK
jgi:hypothetical protein